MTDFEKIATSNIPFLGGPLVCVENNMPILYGVSSWTSRCGEEGKPGIYTKISAIKSWLNGP